MTAYRENVYEEIEEPPMTKTLQNPDSEDTKFARIVAGSMLAGLLAIIAALFFASLYSSHCDLVRVHDEIQIKRAEADRAMFESMTRPRAADGGAP